MKETPAEEVARLQRELEFVTAQRDAYQHRINGINRRLEQLR